MPPITRLSDVHAQLAIVHTMEVRREEYLDHMTFKANLRPLFTEPFGPIIGLKEESAAQGASPAEIDMSAFRYRRSQNGGVPVHTGWYPPLDEQILSETDDHVLARDQRGRLVKLPKGF